MKAVLAANRPTLPAPRQLSCRQSARRSPNESGATKITKFVYRTPLSEPPEWSGRRDTIYRANGTVQSEVT
jgi:hypothetical protein